MSLRLLTLGLTPRKLLGQFCWALVNKGRVVARVAFDRQHDIDLVSFVLLLPMPIAGLD